MLAQLLDPKIKNEKKKQENEQCKKLILNHHQEG